LLGLEQTTLPFSSVKLLLSRLLSHPSLSFVFPSYFLVELPLFLHFFSPADGGSISVDNSFIEFCSSNLESESLLHGGLLHGFLLNPDLPRGSCHRSISN
jgi:hypothetical protein